MGIFKREPKPSISPNLIEELGKHKPEINHEEEDEKFPNFLRGLIAEDPKDKK